MTKHLKFTEYQTGHKSLQSILTSRMPALRPFFAGYHGAQMALQYALLMEKMGPSVLHHCILTFTNSRIGREGSELGITLVGHEAPIEVALFNPRLFKVNVNGDIKPRAIVALGSQDTGVSVWCTATSRAIVSAQRLFKNIVFDLTWSPDGYTLFAASNDGTIALLQFDYSELGVHADESDLENTLSQYKVRSTFIPESVDQLDVVGNLMEKLPINQNDIVLNNINQHDVNNINQNAVNNSIFLNKTTQQQVNNFYQEQTIPKENFGQEVNILNPVREEILLKQKESFTKDGRKRIQPVLLQRFLFEKF